VIQILNDVSHLVKILMTSFVFQLRANHDRDLNAICQQLLFVHGSLLRERERVNISEPFSIALYFQKASVLLCYSEARL
jgi:hypothetical protein